MGGGVLQGIKIEFVLKELPFYCVYHKKGRKTLEIQALDGIATVSVLYDYDRRTLDLNGEVKAGDTVKVILYEHRIELYINEELADEEWPEGNRLFDIDNEHFPNAEISAQFFTNEEKEEPSIKGSFENAEGWYPGKGVFVGDCMPYVRNGEYHVLYLKDRHHHKSKWGMGAHQWEHISTKDFKEWNIHPMAVPITDKSEGSICTGSWISHNGKEYLYYTVRRSRGKPALICRSISNDGYHFVKDKDFSFTVSKKYHSESARDPKVFWGKDNQFHMILTTTYLKENKGCLAHYVSKDLEVWRECEEPFYIVPNGDQPECPDYFEYNGKYYLIFSLRGRARYMVSDNPFDGFEYLTEEPIPCAGVPKCAKWSERLVFTGFKVINGYAGTMTFKAARAEENGRLVFEEL